MDPFSFLIGAIAVVNAIAALVQTVKQQEQTKKVNKLEIELSSLKKGAEPAEEAAAVVPLRKTILPPSRLP